jgi:Glucose / Sorbosone dehydrogenase
VPGGLKSGTRVAVAAIALAVLVAGAGWGLGGPSDSQARVGDGRGGIAKRKIGSFAAPTYVTHAPGKRGFLYVVQQRGAVIVVDHGHARRKPFLAIRGRVSSGGERGLLSIAFDPHYRRNHLLYAYYTNRRGNIQIDEFHARSNAQVASGSRRTVLVVPHPGESNHNGGQLQFGPDGYLYAGTGDGGGGGDPGENAQDKGVLLGKLLRIDPHKSGDRAYTVPSGNPYGGKPGRDEIYALGLRNPFRFSFDHGRILIGDVGESRFEEVDDEGRRELRGANFGWNHFEGRHVFRSATPLPRAHYEPPIFEYRHGSRRCAIIGGYVVHDRRLKSLTGRYLYTDNCAGGLRSFVPHRRRGKGDRRLGIHVDSPSSFGEGPGGTIYVASLAGPVYKLIHR